MLLLTVYRNSIVNCIIADPLCLATIHELQTDDNRAQGSSPQTQVFCHLSACNHRPRKSLSNGHQRLFWLIVCTHRVLTGCSCTRCRHMYYQNLCRWLLRIVQLIGLVDLW